LSITLGWLYYKTKKEYLEYVNAGLFYYKWSTQEDIYVGRWKSNNKLSEMSFDRNYDNKYEHIEYYDTSGIHAYTAYDMDGNGFHEKTITYSENDKIREEILDSDNDGFSDETSIFLPENYYITFEDKNFDHQYERVVFRDKNNNIIRNTSLEEFVELFVKK
jgi:hypothetical protein